MFAPTKVWRRWHVKINQNQRRFAVASALAATALPSLVLARGHRVEGSARDPARSSPPPSSPRRRRSRSQRPSPPSAPSPTSRRAQTRRSCARARERCGGRRHRARRGPLVVYNEDDGLVRAARNLPGVEVCQVTTPQPHSSSRPAATSVRSSSGRRARSRASRRCGALEKARRSSRKITTSPPRRFRTRM